MFTLPSLLSLVFNKYVVGSALVLGLIFGVYEYGYYNGHKPYIALQATYEQAQKDFAAQQAALKLADNKEKAKIQNEAKQQIASMSTAIADLSVQLNAANSAIGVCNPPSPAESGQPTNGPGTQGGTSKPEEAADRITISPEILNDTITTAISGITAELEWREYARSTGQVQ